MYKVYGIKTKFSYIRRDRTRIIISYNMEQVDDEHATWSEIYLSKNNNPFPTFEQIKETICEDINDEVRRMIIEDFEWNGHKVWLSMENQQNYKNAADNAVLSDGDTLPVTFRFGDGVVPDYYTFNTSEELDEFWLACSKHITDCVNYGWKLKDDINWANYEEEKVESKEINND